MHPSRLRTVFVLCAATVLTCAVYWAPAHGTERFGVPTSPVLTVPMLTHGLAGIAGERGSGLSTFLSDRPA